MSGAIGLGMTHYPPLGGTDEQMAGILGFTLRDPGIPAEEKDPASWPEQMRAEWSDDHGKAAAAEHRRQLVDGVSRIREKLDDFAPDVVLVWGDDQYENFREEVVPPYCVLAYDDVEVRPFGLLADRGLDNAWNMPHDTTCTLRGDAALARWLTDRLIEDGFDMAYSYKQRADTHFPHSILNTQTFLDYENYGSKLPYRFLPITVNCYGEHLIARRGGLARFDEIKDAQRDPAGPSPQRCMALGAAVARAMRSSGKRVAFVASSSWSHAFLNDKDWHLRPDTAADQRLYDALASGHRKPWREITSREIVDAGQHEMLNWFCLLGAVDELGLGLDWSTFVTTGVFNSNKAFAIYA
ncbi:extradiol ring-cleavage dioxygenase [Amycolatopsis methanolica]|uniref:Extradiol ring-cleavage dioxygenase class III protein subunit B n=1 Tax=Amycolatopsis methanolica 239 TaxID=1068978 RepID=A0A076MQZ5_AMYME|nr:extradiol ring-cleavage dioxygenase [Amycolatopsis methanolica]AIJ21290.1 extradiol ring-cleavage dioxygenase class III protein subunit B [Amycolatopsis methanolica 239]